MTLDTGRLPPETYQMIETVRERYGITVEVVFPDASEVESMVGLHGPNLFYRETANRMLCCEIRKSRPLERKLKGMKAWAVGLRRPDPRAFLGVPMSVGDTGAHQEAALHRLGLRVDLRRVHADQQRRAGAAREDVGEAAVERALTLVDDAEARGHPAARRPRQGQHAVGAAGRGDGGERVPQRGLGEPCRLLGLARRRQPRLRATRLRRLRDDYDPSGQGGDPPSKK